MAKLSGDFAESFLVQGPADRVAEFFSDLDNIAGCQGSIERSTRVDHQTLHLLLKPRSAQGTTFQGDYQVRYSRSSPQVLVWQSLPSGNMRVQGQARFEREGAQTRVFWQEEVETEIPVGLLLSKIIAPIVKFEIRRGIKEYIESMCAAYVAQQS